METSKITELIHGVHASIDAESIKHPFPEINLLDVLNVLHDENKNSDVIASLINQKSVGRAFLKWIGRYMNDMKACADDFPVRAIREDSATGKGNEKGRTDIVVMYGDHRIVIENKILAGDGDGQLGKYMNHWESKGFFVYYFYLTLRGTQPSGKSLYGNGMDGDPIVEKVIDEGRLISISYKDDIIGWLDEWEKMNKDQSKDYVWSAVEQYKGAVIQMVYENVKINSVKEIQDTLLSLSKDECDVLSIASNVCRKLNMLKEIGEELEEKLAGNPDTSHLADQIRFSISQQILIKDFEEYRKECFKNLDPHTHLGVVCLAKDPSVCYGVGYEFDCNWDCIKRRIGFMLADFSGSKFWEGADSLKEATESAKVAASILYNKILDNLKLYRK